MKTIIITRIFSLKMAIMILLAAIVKTHASDPIIIDGVFDDWSNVPILALDPAADHIIEDFSELRVTNDNDFLFLYFSFHNGDQLLQDSNEVILYIDTDNNPETGFTINGIGAELEWNIGMRYGYFHSITGSDSIYQNDITLRRAPTVSAEIFEFAISRESNALTLNGVQIADTILILLRESDPSGDTLPDEGGTIRYVFDPTFIAPTLPISLYRYNDNDIRVLTYNVQNHLWHTFDDNDLRLRLERILKALDPDIIAFQHVHTDSTIDSLIKSWFPDDEWHMMGNYGPPGEYFLSSDKFVFSKYPIPEQEFNFIASQSMNACLIDTKQELGTDLLLINTHLPAYSRNDIYRQRDADKFIQAMREWRIGNGPFALTDTPPFLVLGDFNMYGKGQVLRTLVEGDIWDENIYGEDFAPDWDSTPLANLFSRHTHSRMSYTWRQDSSPFDPGKLDYFLYSNSVMEIGNHYILNTLAMPDADLVTYGLQKDDTDMVSRHLPHVLDISMIHPVGIEKKAKIDLPAKFQLNSAYPNPFNPNTKIAYQIHHKSYVTLTIYNISGKKIKTLVKQNQGAGEYVVNFNAGGLASGVYIYKLKAGTFEESRKMLLLR